MPDELLHLDRSPRDLRFHGYDCDVFFILKLYQVGEMLPFAVQYSTNVFSSLSSLPPLASRPHGSWGWAYLMQFS
jgi:hypothetical protein